MTRPASIRLTTLAALAALATGGCGGLRTSNLHDIYAYAREIPDSHRNPVIVIPGILGSKLAQKPGDRVVWGAFSGDYANPERPDGARLAALPMEIGTPLAGLTDDVVPAGVLDRIRVSLLHVPVELDAYRHILGTLGVGGYRDQGLAEAGAAAYPSDHFTCFQFAYDWRRDNAENAARLHDFILEKRAYVREQFAKRYDIHDAEVRFDIVAHSMGGLVTRYLLRYGNADLEQVAADAAAEAPVPWAGAPLVDRVILVGTPNAGSAEALVQLVEGKRFAFFLPRYDAALMGTMPSIYQLLPRTKHQAVRDETGRPIDVLDPAIWETRGWGLAAPEADAVLAKLLPAVADAAERRRIAVDHQRKCLERARLFHAVLDRPAPRPPAMRLSLVAGDAKPTAAVVEVGEGGRVRVVERRAGDGTVLRSSAVMDERLAQPRPARPLETPIDWSEVTFLFTDHLGLTTDPVFTDNVLHELLESARGMR